MAEKDEYTASLERRLLAQHKRMTGKTGTGTVSRVTAKPTTTTTNNVASGGGVGGRGGGGVRGGGGGGRGVRGGGVRGEGGEGGGGGDGSGTGAEARAGINAKSGAGVGGMSAGAAAPMATGGGWMGGADGRTPAAREAMRLTKRAMVETGAGGGPSPGRDHSPTPATVTSSTTS